MSHPEPKPLPENITSAAPEPATLKPAPHPPLAPAKRPQSRVPASDSRARRRWMPIALGSAILLTLVTIAGIVLITRPASTVDQLLILTVPSGADITFDSQALGRSPVKLEGVRIGTHRLLVTKDGFDTLDRTVSVSNPTTLDYKLSPTEPKDAEGLSKDDKIRKWQQQGEDAFNRGDYAVPYDGSALYFADMITGQEETNSYGTELRERVRGSLLQAAQSAMARSDLGQMNEIFQVLTENFSNDDAAKAAAAKLESQLASHRGDVRELLRKGEDALSAGRLIDPPNASAYYFAKQVLALDRQNAQARAIRAQVHDKVKASIDLAVDRGDMDDAGKQLNRATRLFPDDKQIGASLREAQERQHELQAKQNEPAFRKNRGMQNYQDGFFEEAIPDLEFANEREPGTTAVIFDLGRSYYKVHKLDKALYFLRLVPQTSGDAYRSSLGVQGDIFAERGDVSAALDHYTQARALGGSLLYDTDDLTEKIERLSKKAAAKASEPSALMIQVKHLHGGLLHGSCTGTLTVNSNGVRYDGQQDTFSSSLAGTEVAISKGELIVKFLSRQEKFKPSRPEMAEKFREALIKFQTYNP